MKAMLAVGALSLTLLASGCATMSDVKQQVDPLAARLSQVESRLSALENQVNAQAADVQAAKRDAADAKAQAQRAEATKAFELRLHK